MPKPYYRAESYGADNSIGFLIRRANTLMTPQAEARFADQELTFSHWIVLRTLGDGAIDTCADLSRHMNHDSGATTRLIDQLERRGLVKRTRSKSDRRVVHLSLTAEGVAFAKALTPRIIGYWNEMLDGFSHAEAAALVGFMKRLVARMESEPENAEAAAKPGAAR